MAKKKTRTEKVIPQNIIEPVDIQESLALQTLLDRSKKNRKEGQIEPLRNVMNDIRAKAKQLKPIPKYVSGKPSKPAKTLKDLKEIITGLPKLGKDAEQFLKDIGNVKKLAGKYKGPTDLSGNHDVYHDLDHLANFDPRSNRAPVPPRYELMMKRAKLLGRIDAEVHDGARANRALSKKWHEFVMSLEYKKERPDVKAFLGLSFAVRELGESEGLSDLIEIAIKTAPLFLKRFGYYGDTEAAVYWVKNPQPALKGDIPWMLMHTEWGRRRVRKAMLAEFGSYLIEALRETATRLDKIGLINTKKKDDIYFASVKALRKVLGKNTKMSEKDIAALAKLAAEGKVKLPTKKGNPKGFKGLKIKGEPLSDIIIKDRR